MPSQLLLVSTLDAFKTSMSCPLHAAFSPDLGTFPWDALFQQLLSDSQREEGVRPTPGPGSQPQALHSLTADDHLEYIASGRFVEAVPSKVRGGGGR